MTYTEGVRIASPFRQPDAHRVGQTSKGKSKNAGFFASLRTTIIGGGGERRKLPPEDHQGDSHRDQRGLAGGEPLAGEADVFGGVDVEFA